MAGRLSQENCGGQFKYPKLHKETKKVVYHAKLFLNQLHLQSHFKIVLYGTKLNSFFIEMTSDLRVHVYAD